LFNDLLAGRSFSASTSFTLGFLSALVWDKNPVAGTQHKFTRAAHVLANQQRQSNEERSRLTDAYNHPLNHIMTFLDPPPSSSDC